MSTFSLTVGLPGCGKDDFLRTKGFKHHNIVSPQELAGPDFPRPDAVAIGWRLAYEEIGKALADKDKVVVNSSFPTRISRSALLGIARGLGYATRIYDFTGVPLDICMQRADAESGAHVPAHIVRKMRTNLELPDYEEGVDLILLVDEAGRVREVPH